jgi:hypothetical protein
MTAAALLNFAAGLVSGAGGTVLIESWLKPRQARKRAAVLLRAEIQKNPIAATSPSRGYTQHGDSICPKKTLPPTCPSKIITEQSLP